MIRLAAAMLRRRIGSAIATLLALTAGVALLTAMGALLESGLRYQAPPGQYAGADVVVARHTMAFTPEQTGGEETVTVDLPAGGTVPDALADRIRRVPGVATVVADHQVAVVVAGPATGHGWSSAVLTPYKIIAGSPPAGPGDVVLDARVAGGAEPGRRTTLLVAGVPQEYLVTGIAEGTGPASVFFTDARATALSAAPGRAAAIGVLAAPGVDVHDLAARIGTLADADGADAYSGRNLGRAEHDPAAPEELLIAVGGTFGGYVALLVMFVVAGTLGLSVRHRRRDLALLRAIAATPGQVRRIIVAESGLLGLISAAAGVPAGLLAIGWAHHQFVDRGFLPASFPMVTGGFSVLIAAGAILVLSMVSGLIAARRVTRIRPAEALGEAAAEPLGGGRVRLVFGVLTLGGAGAAATFAGATSGSTAVNSAIGMLYLFVTAVALLAPWINRVAAHVLGPALRAFWGPSGYLAAKNLKANAKGMTTVLTSLVLSVGFGGSVWFLQDNVQRATVSQNREGTLADVTLVSPAGLPAAAAAEARRIPGVRAAVGVQHTSVLTASESAAPVEAQAIDPDGADAALDLRVVAGRLSDLGPETVAVSRLQADSAGWTLGGRATFWLGDGTPVTPRVVAVYERGLGFGDVTLPRQTVTGHTGNALDERILIRTEPGAATAEALATLATRYPGSAIATTVGLNDRLAADLSLGSWLNKLLIGVMVGYAALAAANTMVMAALARRRELSLLRLVGVTARQAKRMVHAEQVGLLGIALVIGGGIAAGTLTTVVGTLTGNLMPYVPALGWIAVLGGTTFLALATTILPVGRLLRIAPIHSIGIKE
ncbi:permease [Actinoplanes sp. SE50]|uniref:ABC transporter permease n=1 Tax=unclassified Actinoplanes TaxID=2626549 RepID=UPI00023EC889|nr:MULTISPECIES: ABC transporter permease [unclassified Actinoplanes]AEV87649.1 Macrolide export ATP-binding/permease protein macB [Actinoplanes sp. SE50/110]ATO86052.1 permease [Actinoplanes sp. SE50]SLM03466.1 permease [Actinoplanes sp. SE50/110]